MTRPTALRLLLVIALLAVFVGAAMFGFALMQPASAQWFAYAPLSQTTFRPDGARLLSDSELAGVAVFVVGLVAFAFWAGIRVGIRRRDDA